MTVWLLVLAASSLQFNSMDAACERADEEGGQLFKIESSVGGPSFLGDPPVWQYPSSVAITNAICSKTPEEVKITPAVVTPEKREVIEEHWDISGEKLEPVDPAPVVEPQPDISGIKDIPL